MTVITQMTLKCDELHIFQIHFGQIYFTLGPILNWTQTKQRQNNNISIVGGTEYTYFISFITKQENIVTVKMYFLKLFPKPVK